ncbi:MAG: hypothetical protein WED10_00785 [Brumimicrobium sp.]
MEFLILILYLLGILGITWFINKQYLSEFKSYLIPTLFVFKFGIALFFLYVYTYHYGGGELTADARRFFDESKLLHQVFYESPTDYFKLLFGFDENPKLIDKYLDATSHWNVGDQLLPNDSRNVIKINSLFLFLSNGQVVIHFLFFSLASFLGGIDLYQFVKKHSKLPKGLLIILMTLTPSIAFWSSSIIKEPLMILGLCLVIRATFDNLSLKQKAWRFLVGGVFLIGFKPYVFLCLLVAFSFYWIFSRISKNQALNLAIFFIVGFTTLYFSGIMNKAVNVISKQQEDFINVRDGGLYVHEDDTHYYYIYFKNRNHFEIEGDSAKLIAPVGAYHMKINENYIRRPVNLTDVGKKYKIGVRLQKAGSGIPVTPIKDNPITMITMIPEVIFNTMVRPIPDQKSSWLQYPAFLENILIILGIIMAFIIYPRKLEKQDQRILITLGIFSFVVMLIVGWTTPVVGAIVRYIIPSLLGIVLIIALKIDRIPFLERIFTPLLKK